MITAATAIGIWLSANSAWIGGAFVIAEVITRLTPTRKDDSVLGWIKKIYDFILPNLKKEVNGKVTTHSKNKTFIGKLFKKK